MDDCHRYAKKALIQKFEKRLTFGSYRLEKDTEQDSIVPAHQI